MPSVFDFSAKLNNGDDKPLADYRGKVLLIVNTASRCGNTPQYKGLEELYENIASRDWRFWPSLAISSATRSRAATRKFAVFCETQLRRHLSRCSPKSRSMARARIRSTSI